MSGTLIGGRKAAEKNKQNDPEFYKKIGHLGGSKGRTGGFASTAVGIDGMDGKTRASVYGTIGGRKSRRTKKGDN